MDTGSAADRAHMRRALDLAERGWGRVHPNPLVGAVVVRGGEVVAEGWHGEYGGPHAEVAVLAAAGERAAGATLYVTLEPCSHVGKTPACTDAIRRAGVARVVYGASDPSSEAAGGADLLRQAGIRVDGGVEEDAARAQNAIFFHAVERATPYVALKYGLSLDARLGDRPGLRTDVTGPAAQAEVHRLRAGFDAVLVGIGTALADDPLLTARGEPAPRRPPARIVLDSAARLPLDSRLLRTAAEAPVWVVCTEAAPEHRRAALEAAGARLVVAEPSLQGVSLEAALDAVWAAGLRSVLCEGGGRLGTALLAADRVERLYLFYAPRLYGEGGTAAFPGELPAALASGWRVRDLARFGDDVLLTVDRRRLFSRSPGRSMPASARGQRPARRPPPPRHGSKNASPEDC